jgi:hypothetical protein
MTGPVGVSAYGMMFGLSGRDVSMTGAGLSPLPPAPMTGMTGASLVNMTYADALTGSTLTVVNTGTYFMTLAMDGASGQNNIEIITTVGVNGVSQDIFSLSRHYSSMNDDGSASISGLLPLTAADSLSVIFTGTGAATVDFQTHNVNLTVLQVG